MAATILTPDTERKTAGTIEIVITIPTTVDGTNGGTCIVSPPIPVRTLTGTVVSSNFNGKTLAVKASNDGVNFTAVATAISVASTGNFVIAAADIGFRYYQITFSGAPTVAVVVTLVATET
jgi:hypothetical protein